MLCVDEWVVILCNLFVTVPQFTTVMLCWVYTGCRRTVVVRIEDGF